MREEKDNSETPDLVVRVMSDKQDKPKNKVEDILKIVGLFFAAASLIFTGLTYRAAQAWKVAEFTSQKFNEFSENSSVKLVNGMLDYNEREFALFDEDSLVAISDEVIYAALVVDSIDGEFSKTETRIRDVFDEYFDQLSLFNRYATAGLIDYDEIKPYLIYQTSIICDKNNPRKTNKFRFRIWDYINYYKFNDVKELYKNFGYDLKK